MLCLRRSVSILALVGLLLVGAPGRAQASPETLKRSVQNLLFAPLDLALAPWVAGRSWWSNWNSVDDSPAVHWTYAAPGLVWMNAMQVGTAALRFVAGSLELLPGLALVPFESDISPIFNLAEENASLVDREALGFSIRFGINYTSSSAAY